MKIKLHNIYALLFALSLIGCSDNYVSGTYIVSNSKYSLSMSTSSLQNIPAEGGVVKARIEATSAVNWEIQGLPSWLSTTTLKGSGSQDVSFNAESNESYTSSRTHIFNITTSNDDWKTTTPVSATQSKKYKSLSVSPSDNNSLTFEGKGGQKLLSVTSNVAWEASCNETFVHLSRSSAAQDLNIIVTVDAYYQIDITQSRTATIYFKDAKGKDILTVVTITQTPLQASISTENISVEFDQNKNSKVYSFKNVLGNYSVSSDASWLTINKNNETANVDVTISVKTNENDEERTSTAYVYLDASNTVLYTFAVKQKGNSLRISIDSLSVSADGGIYSVEVNTIGQWTASTPDDWITIQDDWVTTQESGTTCQVSVSENNTLQNRSGVVRFNRLNDDNGIVGKTKSLIVDQEARHITPDMQTIQFSPDTETKSISINSDAEWTLSTYDSWISLSAQSGTGDSKVDVTVEDNTSTTSRTGTLMLSCLGKTIEITVVQNSGYLNTTSNAIQFESKGGTANISVSSNLQWSIESEANWITITPNEGDENEEVTLSVSRNETSAQRNGVVSIHSLLGTYKINVAQSAPSLKLSKTIASFDENGGTEVIVVYSDYDYSVTTSDSWIKIVNNQNSFSIQTERNGNALRTGTITVQIVGIEGTISRTITVIQACDDTTPYIDLGLPSKTTWSAYNRGASKVGGTGSLYTGTESNSFNCPTISQIEELIKNCTWSYTTQDGITGYSVVGPNGNSIFFPNTTIVNLDGNYIKGMYLWIRGSSSSESQYYLRYFVGIRTDCIAHKDQSKFSIREVR